MNLDFEKIRAFSPYLRLQIGKTIKMGEATNNAEQFCGQRKERNFKREHFTKFCAGLHEIFGFHWFSFIFCHLHQRRRVHFSLTKY